jgi:hypothetical protein
MGVSPSKYMEPMKRGFGHMQEYADGFEESQDIPYAPVLES